MAGIDFFIGLPAAPMDRRLSCSHRESLSASGEAHLPYSWGVRPMAVSLRITPRCVSICTDAGSLAALATVVVNECCSILAADSRAAGFLELEPTGAPDASSNARDTTKMDPYRERKIANSICYAKVAGLRL